MMKRRAALLLAIMMILAAAPILPVSALGRGDAARLCLEGSGTKEEPYLIRTGEELCALSAAVNAGSDLEGVYIELADDIELYEKDWQPIGSGPRRGFAGSFDGRGHSVYGMTVDTGRSYAGLFGYSTGAISGVILRDATVRGGDFTGGIAGFGSAENCEVYGAVSGKQRVGGITGEGSAFDCVNRAEVRGIMEVGGVVGEGEAHRCKNAGEVSGRSRVGGITGLGSGFECESGSGVFEAEPADTRAKHSVSKFIKWGLKHIDPASIPTNASLYLSTSSCGTEPWEYLYGSVRVSTSQTSINNYYSNYYNKFMFRDQYDEIVEDWSRSTYATDCQGLLDCWMTYVEGEDTDINVQMNYSDWCTSKGEIASINRSWVIGEAVFVYSQKLQKMGHIGWVCGFDEDGQPLILEARGLYFGVVVTRLKDRSWTHRGLMTVKFNYDASKSSDYEYAPEYDDEDIGFIEEEERLITPCAVWDGSVSSSYGGGSGTEDDPYQINTASQLARIAYKVQNGTTYSGKYFVLNNDIWLNDTDGWTSWDFNNRPANEWTPIGCYVSSSENYPFRGSFDGQGHTVYGMFFSENRKSFYGLFGYVGTNTSGCIKNVKIARSFMECVDNCGAIVGYAKNYGRIENCSNAGKVRGDHWVGGIVGYVANTSGTTTVTGCKNTSYNVRGATDTGGIVGFAHENCTVTGCSNTASYVKAYQQCGGIIGSANSSKVEKCRNNGEVRGAYYIGGIAGSISSTTVDRCYSGHDFTPGFRSGGVVGTATGGSITNCFNTGSLTSVEIVGGVVGRGNGVSVARCYNVGTISAKRNRGGVIGKKNDSTSISNAYMLEGCCSGGNSSGTYLPRASFASASSYSGFDFDSVWKIDPATDYPFAELRAVSYTSELIPAYTPSGNDPTPTPTAAPSSKSSSYCCIPFGPWTFCILAQSMNSTG